MIISYYSATTVFSGSPPKIIFGEELEEGAKG